MNLKDFKINLSKLIYEQECEMGSLLDSRAQEIREGGLSTPSTKNESEMMDLLEEAIEAGKELINSIDKAIDSGLDAEAAIEGLIEGGKNDENDSNV